MKFLRIAILAVLFIASPALAQWQVGNHAVPIGRGGGVVGFGSASPGTAGNVLQSTGPTSDPSFGPFTSLISAACTALPNVCSYLFGYSNVQWYGAAGAGGVDDTTPIMAAEAYQASANGGTVYFPPPPGGIYCTYAGITSTSPGIAFVGTGRYGTSLSACGHDVQVLTINASNNQVRNIQIIGKGSNGDPVTFGATKSALYLGTNCVGCLVEDVTLSGGLHAWENHAGEVRFNRVSGTQSYGSSVCYNVGGGWFDNISCDQGFPAGPPAQGSTFPNWSAGLSVTAGAAGIYYLAASGVYIQYTQSGTTGSVAPTPKNYGLTFNDGSAQAQIVIPNPYYNLQLDTGTHEFYATQGDFSGTAVANIAMTNTLSGAAPNSFKCVNCVVSAAFADNMLFASGSYVNLVNPSVGTCYQANCNTISFEQSFGGNATILGGFAIGNPVGLALQVGSNYLVEGIDLSNNTVGASLSGAVDYATLIGNNLNGGSFTYTTSGTHNVICLDLTLATCNANLNFTGTLQVNGHSNNTAGGFVVPASSLTLYGPVYGGGSGGSPVSAAAGTNGQLFLGVTSAAPQWGTMSGDATIANTGVLTLATVNSNVGTFGSATSCVTVTNNAKGLTTAISAATCAPAVSSVTGLGTGVATALATNVGTAGSPVINGGALGTPSSGTLTNATGLPTTALTGTLQAAQEPAHTGDVTNTASSLTLTLATVNSNVGSFGSATQCVSFTTNGKGLITAASATTCTPAIGSITGLGTGVATALANAVNASGGSITYSGVLGSPTATQITTPTIIGGSGTTGNQLTLQTTTGVGTTDAIAFKGGNNGASSLMTITDGSGTGNVTITGWLSAGTPGSLAAGDFSAARSATQGLYAMGSDSAVYMFRNGTDVSLNGAATFTANAAVLANSYKFTNLLWSNVAPTISSGFCATSPSITASNGSAAFDINVGTSCSGSTGTLAMPAATTGWACQFTDVTTSTNVPRQTGGATNTVTLTNYSWTTGVAANFTASDHIRAQCTGY